MDAIQASQPLPIHLLSFDPTSTPLQTIENLTVFVGTGSHLLFRLMAGFKPAREAVVCRGRMRTRKLAADSAGREDS